MGGVGRKLDRQTVRIYLTSVMPGGNFEHRDKTIQPTILILQTEATTFETELLAASSRRSHYLSVIFTDPM